MLMYSSVDPAIFEELAAAFKETHGLEVTNLRLGAADLRERFASEAEAGVFAADLVFSGEVSNQVWADHIDRGWIEPMSSELVPRVAEIDDSWMPLPHAIIVFAGFLNGVSVNTDLVPPEDAPAAFEDLLEPEWFEQLFGGDPTLSNDTLGMWGALMDEYGEEFVADLAAQEPEWSQASPSMGLVAAGERKGCLGCVDAHIGALLAEAPDAPVALHYLEDLNFLFTPMAALSAQSPAPNSARLFLSWLLSEEGQLLIAGANKGVPVREGVVIPGARPLPADPADYVLSDVNATNERRAEILGAMGISE